MARKSVDDLGDSQDYKLHMIRGGSGRNYINTKTGEVISRRLYDRLRGAEGESTKRNVQYETMLDGYRQKHGLTRNQARQSKQFKDAYKLIIQFRKDAARGGAKRRGQGHGDYTGDVSPHSEIWEAMDVVGFDVGETWDVGDTDRID